MKHNQFFRTTLALVLCGMFVFTQIGGVKVKADDESSEVVVEETTETAADSSEITLKMGTLTLQTPEGVSLGDGGAVNEDAAPALEEEILEEETPLAAGTGAQTGNVAIGMVRVGMLTGFFVIMAAIIYGIVSLKSKKAE